MQSKMMDRRTFLKKGGALLIVCTGAGLGPSLARKRKVFRNAVILMGTVAEVQIVHDDARQAARIMEQAFLEMARIERLMSRFRDDSEIGKANALAFQQPVPVSQETLALIAKALHYAKITKGVFDPAIGQLAEIWDIKNRIEPPAAIQLSRLADRQLYQKVHLAMDPREPFLRYSSADVRLDLGGIGKGYAADRAIAVLAEAGVEQALVNLGGDVVTLGGKSQGQAWKVGLKDPHPPHKIVKVLHLRNQAVATSGNYEQYFIAQSKLYHHLINPALAQPGRSQFHSLTVVGPNGCDTDALATGLFFFPVNESNRLLETHTEGFRTIRFG